MHRDDVNKAARKKIISQAQRLTAEFGEKIAKSVEKILLDQRTAYEKQLLIDEEAFTTKGASLRRPKAPKQ